MTTKELLLQEFRDMNKEQILQRFRNEFCVVPGGTYGDGSPWLKEGTSEILSFLTESLDELEKKTREEERKLIVGKIRLMERTGYNTYIVNVNDLLSHPEEEKECRCHCHGERCYVGAVCMLPYFCQHCQSPKEGKE